jgi:hypothetical protein
MHTLRHPLLLSLYAPTLLCGRGGWGVRGVFAPARLDATGYSWTPCT